MSGRPQMANNRHAKLMAALGAHMRCCLPNMVLPLSSMILSAQTTSFRRYRRMGVRLLATKHQRKMVMPL